MFLEKIKWAYRLLRSRTFVLMLDKSSVVQIPLANIDSFESSFLLNAQSASLQEFKTRLEDLIHEHEDAIQLLSHRERNTESRKPRLRTKVSKNPTKTKQSK